MIDIHGQLDDINDILVGGRHIFLGGIKDGRMTSSRWETHAAARGILEDHVVLQNRMVEKNVLQVLVPGGVLQL